MWSKPTASHDYAKPLLCSLALHAVLAVLFYLSPYPTIPNIMPPVTVSLVHQQTLSSDKHREIQAPTEPRSTPVVRQAQSQPELVTSTSPSNLSHQQTNIESASHTQMENPQKLIADTPISTDSVTLAQPQPDSVQAGSRMVTEAIAEPIFDAAYLQNPEPTYPSFARRLQQQGIVKLRVKVSEKGLAEIIELAESSGFKLLDESAQKTVKSWRFVPAKRGAEAISAWVIVPIRFQLS